MTLEIKQIQQTLFLQRIVAYILLLRYVQILLSKDRDKEYDQKEENYSYDPVGNRLFGPKPIEFYSYNRGNQLTNDKKHQYEYDRNGNLIKKTELDDDGKTKVTVYSYDYENRLIRVEIQKDDEKKIVTFSYDPFGRRISKSLQYQSLRGEAEAISDDDRDKGDHDYEKPRTTYYVYDNEDIIAEYNGKGKITARYTHGLGIDEPLAVKKKDHTYYYHADGLGSITSLTDTKGKTAQTYEYDSFGNLKNHEQKIKQPYTYTAREWDSETKLYYYRARYYDAKVGRFTSFDPILHFANARLKCDQINTVPPIVGVSLLENPQNFNPFIYVSNNPMTRTDPSGLHMDCLRGGCHWHLSCIDNHEHPNRDAVEGQCFYDPPVEIPEWLCKLGVNAGCNALCKKAGGNFAACQAACRSAAQIICPKKCE
ncbi:MAG: RHS repeat protein [Nitrospirae bacterium]|nr:MAG: RHS repeat protein [Nitrospirota bacterium]